MLQLRKGSYGAPVGPEHFTSLCVRNNVRFGAHPSWPQAVQKTSKFSIENGYGFFTAQRPATSALHVLSQFGVLGALCRVGERGARGL